MTQSNQDAKNYKIEDYSINEEPFYIPTSDEIKVFESAYNQKVPVLLKGPTGTGKTRFVAIEFEFPSPELETKIIQSESGVDEKISDSLASLGEKIRNLTDHGLTEAASTRVLIYAGKLIKDGIEPRRACQVAVTWGITDDQKLYKSIEEIITAIFE